MVLRELGGDAVLCIGQPAHAWLSGQLAAAWGNDDFPAPAPRDEVCLAAAQHDLGMAAWDSAPRLHPDSGWPRSFMQLPIEVHLAMWSEAPRLALTQSRWVALLVSMHGCSLYEGRDVSRESPEIVAAVRGYLDGQRGFQAAMRESLGVGEDEARRNQRLLAAWDWMSLVLCMDRLPADIPRVPGSSGEVDLRMERHADEAVRIAPWPFAGVALQVAVDARRLGRRFTDEEEMRAALEAAPWERLELRLLA